MNTILINSPYNAQHTLQNKTVRTYNTTPTENKTKNTITKNCLFGAGAGLVMGLLSTVLINPDEISGKLFTKAVLGGAIAGLATGLVIGIANKLTKGNEQIQDTIGGIGYGATFGSLASLVLRETFELEKKVSSRKAGTIGGVLGATFGGLMLSGVLKNSQNEN